MQLLFLNLTGNQLKGSLPEAWSNLSNVSPTIVFDQVGLVHASIAPAPSVPYWCCI